MGYAQYMSFTDIFPLTRLMAPILSLLLLSSLLCMAVFAGKINLHKNCIDLYFLSLKNLVSFKMLLILKHRLYIFLGTSDREQLKPLSEVSENKIN